MSVLLGEAVTAGNDVVISGAAAKELWTMDIELPREADATAAVELTDVEHMMVSVTPWCMTLGREKSWLQYCSKYASIWNTDSSISLASSAAAITLFTICVLCTYGIFS